ncbi:hypothetical protein GCM10023317_96150 [Actinopolymorpha pittospori]|uniref:Uncharacterized protein n=1 Tax=Actinopolymorpha pittospori TaxID=648752 RepID=A0A927MVZ5_9ACTN|nr:hypothetical protein [Actinopolymorpha pittospori]
MTFNLSNVALLADSFYGAGMVRFAHGLLVASAPTSTDAHNEWDPGVAPIHAGPDSLYISVRQAASGHVGVVCIEGPYSPPGLDKLFAGEISLPDASLAIYDPNGAMGLRLPVAGKRNRIEVYGDDPEESSQVCIVLTEIA